MVKRIKMNEPGSKKPLSDDNQGISVPAFGYRVHNKYKFINNKKSKFSVDPNQ